MDTDTQKTETIADIAAKIRSFAANLIRRPFSWQMVAGDVRRLLAFVPKGYDVYTENSTNEERWKEWDDRKRTSMTNWCGYTRSLKPCAKAGEEDANAGA